MCGSILMEVRTAIRQDRQNIPEVLELFGKYSGLVEYIKNGYYPSYCTREWMTSLKSNFGSYYLRYNILFQLCQSIGFDLYNSLVIGFTIGYWDILDFWDIDVRDLVIISNIDRLKLFVDNNEYFPLGVEELMLKTVVVSKILKLVLEVPQSCRILDLFIKMYYNIVNIMDSLNIKYYAINEMLTSIEFYLLGSLDQLVEYIFLEYELEGVPKVRLIDNCETEYFNIFNYNNL
jgi:hypothetical protein